MIALVPIGFSAVQHMKHNEFTACSIKGEANTPLANSKPILTNERLDGLNVTVASLHECFDRRQDLSSLPERDGFKFFSCWLADYDTQTHKSMPHSSASSCSVLVGSPARSDALATATAARSSSVSGSSEGRAFVKASITGSSFSASGMGQLWLTQVGLATPPAIAAQITVKRWAL